MVTPEGFDVPMGKPTENKEPTAEQFNKTLKYDKNLNQNINYNNYYNTW